MLGDLIVALTVVFAPADKFPWAGLWDLGADKEYLLIEVLAAPATYDAVTGAPDDAQPVLGTPVRMTFCQRAVFEGSGTCAPYGESVPCKMVPEGLLCEHENPFPYRAQIRALNEGKILYSFQDVFSHGVLEAQRVSDVAPPRATPDASN